MMQPRLLSLVLGALAFALPSHVSAFSDTSPYFLISSVSTVPESLRSHKILSTSSFFTAASDVIRACKADAYVLVSQPGIHMEDITTDKNTGVHLKDLFDGVDKSGRWIVENTYADKQKDMFAVIEKLQYVAVTACDALVEDIDAKTAMFKTFDGVKPKVVRVDFDRLPASGAARAKAVEQNDAFLHSVMDMLPTKKYTVIFVSSPIGETAAATPVKFSTPQEEHAANLELRSVEFETEARNATLVKGGLFHRYQFFTPAIFMGYIVFFLMLAILYVGVSAVSSIGVSYGSFVKEMGPGAKKQQ